MKKSTSVEFCGKLPLIGKYLVRPLFLWGYDAAKQGETSKKLTSIAALGGVALLHAPNAVLGGVEVVNHLNSQPLLAAYDGLYCAVNALVVYTQLHLGTKVATTEQETTETVIGEHSDQYDIGNALGQLLTKQGALAAAVTIGGQAAFGIMNGLA
ncbi:MAG: hypothetical protein JWN38_474 [Candidatus Saccharibacteria bacterium]|nr:hypothetical protein [Candidatus Saccharibacteria bacterium]